MEKEWYEYEFIEFKIFERELKKLCSSEEEENEVKNHVARHRHRGDGIGKSGMKKIRVPIQGRGTRGGGRVIYYYTDQENAFILFMLVYSKAKKEDLSPEEEAILSAALDKELKERKGKNYEQLRSFT
jgi:hypothetical protein